MLPPELAQIIRAFQASRAVLTAIELDVFTAVGDGATAAEVAGRIEADARATEMLLNALVALGFLDKRGDRFLNTPASRRYLSDASPESERLAWLHTVHLWDTWSNLTECVRRGTAVGATSVRERASHWREAFIAAMDRNARERAPFVVQALGTEGLERLLDVGGGSAAYSIAFARACPNLEAHVLDLAEVLPLTQRYIEQAGLAGRVRTIPGDLTRDRFPTGYDLVLVFSICHMLSPEQNQDLLRRCYEALRPGGRLAIQDFILEPEKTRPLPAVLFSLNMLVSTERGASYSELEYRQWLEGAGFENVRKVALPGPVDLMVGTRPS